jgi:hypothetical protein
MFMSIAANRSQRRPSHQCVGRDATGTNKEKMLKRLDQLQQYARSIATGQMKNTESLDFKILNFRKMILQTVEATEEAIKDKELAGEVKQ